MLARTFLTAKDLHCSEDELQAALKVLDMLEHNQIPFVNVEEGERKAGFNILYWNATHADGFCGCLGGWIEHVHGTKLSRKMINAWIDLFEPYKFDVASDYYTPERCAVALHEKLTTGKAIWG